MTNVYEYVRKLAKQDYYQVIYSQAKKLGLRIFENTTDLTQIQMIFINYLCFYHNLFQDIALQEVNEIVTTDIIYEDAYSYYKNYALKKENIEKENNVSTTVKGNKTKQQITQSWGVNFRKGKMKQ